MKNTLSDLNNHLFSQLERLGDTELSGERLAAEIDRSKAITGIATQIIANGTLTLKAAEMAGDFHGRQHMALPKFLSEVQTNGAELQQS